MNTTSFSSLVRASRFPALSLFLAVSQPITAWGNTAPQAEGDVLLATAGSNLSFDYLTFNDSDIDGDPLSVTGTSSPALGTLVANGGNAFTFTPASTGDDTFNYTVSDGTTTDTAAVRVSVNATFNAEDSRDDLLAGVTSLADPGSPGYLVVWGPTAQVISNYPGEDERDPMVAAATMGDGRIIAMPDQHWLDMDDHGSDTSTGNFYRNGITWLNGTDAKNIKIVTLNSKASTWLAGEGYTNVVDSSTSNLATDLVGADVLITWPRDNPSQAVIDEIVSFTKGGGGLFICDFGAGYSWWWNKDGPDIPGNRILRDAGIAFSKKGYHGGSQTINRASFHVTAEHVIDVITNPSAYSTSEKNRAAEVFDRLYGVLADNDTLQARLDEVYETKIAALIPTPTNPVSDSLEKTLLNQEGLILRDLPVSEMTAHRAALPVDPAAPRVTKSITLAEPATGHASRLIDTGLYAAPGEIVTLTLPEALTGKGLQVQIGHLRTDTGDSKYYTMPYQQLTFDVTATSLQVASPHGGLIMFNAPSGTQWTGDQVVQTTGAVEAPYFVLGETTNADWVNGIRDRGTPFGLLVCDSTVLVIESEQWLRTLTDPHEVMSVYNPLITEIGKFYNYDKGRELRIHHDYQAAGGVAAFPLSYVVSKEITNSRLLIIQGEPLTMHEHGHHADSGQIIFYEFGETSPNLGGKYARKTLSNFSWKQKLPVGRINNYLFAQTDDLWNHSNHYKVDVKGTPFDSIGDVFGWESLKNIVHAITNLPSADANSDQKSIDQWLIQTGIETGYDVSPFLELWQLSFSASAKSAVDALPEWNMIELVGEDLVLEQDSSITFGDPTVNDFSYDGSLELTGVNNPSNGSLVNHGDGTWTYTPTAGFTGKDAITYTVVNATGNTYTGTIDVSVTTPANFPALERGKSYAGTAAWTTVNLERTFSSPVVIAQIVHSDGLAPVVSRVRNAAGNSFQLKVQRADGQSGALENVQIQYIVVEEGVYNTTDHGIKMEAVKINSSITDHAGNFTGQPLTLAHDLWDHYFIPSIFGQVMSYNDPDWSTFWASGSATGYTAGKHVGEDSNTTRADETLGYVIMESGSLQIGDVRFQAGSLGYDAYDGFKKITSGGAGHSFTRMPSISGAIVQAQGIDGTEDGYWTALESPVGNGNQVSARIVEDQISDSEQSHGDLAGSYLLISEPGTSAIGDSVTALTQIPVLISPLGNDLSNAGGALSITGFTQPSHGSLVDNGDGTLTYTSDAGYTGPDTFLYTAGNSSGSDVAPISLEVRPTVASTQGVMMDTWTGISGNSTSTMTGLASYPDSPDASELRTTFEAPSNRGVSFGTRMHALLVPPTTGDYTFWIASDDDSQLFLSSDRHEENKTQIANVSGYTASQQWDKSSSQQSVTITLQAGQPYFIEALHKEGGSGDNLAVAWQGPGISQAVITSAYLQTVSWNPPTVANAIQNLTVIQDAPNTLIDLSSVFTDPDLGDSLTLSVHSNNNASLTGVSLNATDLTVSYGSGQSGTSTVTIRATDESGAMVTDTFTITVQPDNDQDKIPDAWEIANGINPFTDDASVDSDGDGVDNWSEYIADTGASNPASFLKLEIDPGTAGSDVDLRLQTSANRRYLFEYSNHLTNGSWLPLLPIFDGDGNEAVINDPIMEDHRFYRVRVSLP